MYLKSTISELRQELAIRANRLKNKGADVDKILNKISIADPYGAQLSSIKTEIEVLELLSKVHSLHDHHYECPEDHTFFKEKISYAVTRLGWDANIIKCSNYLLARIWKEKRRKGYFAQVVFEPCRANRIIECFSTYIPLAKGIVTTYGEIMVPTAAFRIYIQDAILRKAKKLEQKFRIKCWTGIMVGVIDVRHFPVEINYVANYLQTRMSIEEWKLDGVCLLTYERGNKQKQCKNAFVVIPNRKSSSIAVKDYEKIEAKQPVTTRYIVETPMEINPPSPNSRFSLRRDGDGVMIVNEEPTLKSLTSEGVLLVTGFVPPKAGWLEFKGGSQHKKYYF